MDYVYELRAHEGEAVHVRQLEVTEWRTPTHFTFREAKDGRYYSHQGSLGEDYFSTLDECLTEGYKQLNECIAGREEELREAQEWLDALRKEHRPTLEDYKASFTTVKGVSKQ